MVIHVVDQDYEYWLEVTEVKPASLVDPPWTGGVIIETKPIPAGVMARMPRLNPRPYFRTPTSNTPMPTPAERLHDLQAEGALDFIPQDPKDPRGGRELVYITPPESTRVVKIPEFASAGTEHLAEELELKQKAAEELIENNPFPAEQQDQSEPHYAAAREINERQVHDAFGTDRLFANPHMGDPKE